MTNLDINCNHNRLRWFARWRKRLHIRRRDWEEDSLVTLVDLLSQWGSPKWALPTWVPLVQPSLSSHLCMLTAYSLAHLLSQLFFHLHNFFHLRWKHIFLPRNPSQTDSFHPEKFSCIFSTYEYPEYPPILLLASLNI